MEDNIGNRDSLSIMQTIEEHSDLLTKQIMFSKYFVKVMGLNDVKYEIHNMKQHKLRLSAYQGKQTYYHDSFYCSFDKLIGLSNNIGKQIDGTEIMNSFVQIIGYSLDNKMLINDDFLLLGLEYCNLDNLANKNSVDLVNKLIECVCDCLNNDSSSRYSSRSYQYFKKFLLHSSVWNFRYNKNNNNNTNKTNAQESKNNENSKKSGVVYVVECCCMHVLHSRFQVMGTFLFCCVFRL